MQINAAEIRSAQAQLAMTPVAVRNRALVEFSRLLKKNAAEVLRANGVDVRAAQRAQLTSAFLDRLMLNHKRLEDMAAVLREVASASDPLGRSSKVKTLKNGLKARKITRPLGVIFLIFESRPNVAVESFALALKSGNALILKGGRESAATIKVLEKLMQRALKNVGLQPALLRALRSTDRSGVLQLLGMKKLIDVVIPRGGEALIRFVVSHTEIPVIKNDRGLCHVYVDRAADLKMAVKILINAKMQRPGVCNSAETVLVHQTVAKRFFKLFLTELGRQKKTLEIRACKRSHAALLANQRLAPGLNLRRASPKDWNTEHLELILNAAVVSSAPAAQRHIATYGSRHSEAIVTKSRKTAEAFLNSVDAAAVYWNASTRFTDGHQLGLGGEIGISTQKLHVRGPVGLEALTCQQWVLRGSGQIRI